MHKYLLLSLPRIDVYIPKKPLKNYLNYSFTDPPRDFIIQGETLEYFLIVRLSELYSTQKTTKTTNYNKTSSITSNTNKNDPKDSDEEAIITDEAPPLKKLPPREALLKLFNELEVRTEFLRTNTSFKPSYFTKTISSQLNKNSPVSHDEVTNFFKRDPSRPPIPTTTAPHVLPNGDLLFPLTTDVTLKKRHVGQQVLLTATLLPPPPEIPLSALLSPDFTEIDTCIRVMTSPVKVVQPIQFFPEKTVISGALFLAVSIGNRHEEEVLLEDIEVIVGEVGRGKYGDFIDVDYDKSDFPVLLRENEQYNFVVSFQPKPCMALYVDSYSTFNSPELQIRWSTPALSGTMETPFPLSAPVPPKKKLRITFQTEESPIKVHSIFPLHLVVSNLSNQPRDITIEIPLPELDKENDKFFVFSPKKVEEERDRGLKSALPPQHRNSLNIDRNYSSPQHGNFSAPYSPNLINSVLMNNSQPSVPKTPLVGTNVPTLSLGLVGLSGTGVGNDIWGPNLLEAYENGQRKLASIFCLDKTIRVGVVEPQGQTKVTLQCLAMREGLFSIRDVKVFDQKRELTYLVQEPCEIFVIK